MNKILLLLLFILSVKGEAYDPENVPYYKECPSVNVGRGDGIVNCPTEDNYYCKPLFIDDAKNDDSDKFYASDDEIGTNYEECYSQHLYNRKTGNQAMYYNKCCYIKFQTEGKEYNHCVGLTDDQMMDIPVTIKELEEKFTEKTGNEVYIEVLQCNGKYIFYSIISSLLLALIF